VAVADWTHETDRLRGPCLPCLRDVDVEYMAREDEAGGVGLNWASEGLGFVHISVVDFAWKVVLVDSWVGEGEGEGVEGQEMEEHRERGQEREEDGVVGELSGPMRAKERRVMRRREDEQEE
jgi:hypothetical protein